MLFWGTHESGLPLKEMEQTRDWKNEAEKQLHKFVRLENGEKNIPYANFGSVRKLGCKQQAYAHSFVNLKRKKGISATPLNWLLNAFTLALNDSAPALVCLFTK